MHRWMTHDSNIILDKLLDTIGQQDVIVWQQIGDKRIVYHAKVNDVSREKCIVELDPNEVVVNEPDETKPFFLHSKLNDSVFKKNNYEVDGFRLIFSLPSEVILPEKRKYPRFTFEFEDLKMVSFDYNSSLNVSQLLNISYSGLELCMKAKEAKGIEEGKEVIFKHFVDFKLEENFLGLIKHISPSRSVEEDQVFIGVEFKTEIPQDIKKFIEHKEKRSIGISVDHFCGLTKDEQLGKFKAIEKENKQLAINIQKNVKEIDRIRYLTEPMKLNFLESLDLDLIACALRLSSKELVFELLVDTTKHFQEDFLEKLSVAKPASAVCKAQDSIVKTLKQKESDGEYKMDPKVKTTYV